MRRFIISTNLATDKRVSKLVRRTAKRTKDFGVLTNTATGVVNGNGDRIYIDVGVIRFEAREMHASFEEILLRVIDHELAHATCSSSLNHRKEEAMAKRFENAGAWARRAVR